MYGDMHAVITRHGDGSTSTDMLATPNSKLRDDHPYVSGVLVLRRGYRQQDALRRWKPSKDDAASDEATAELNAFVRSITTEGLDTYLGTTYVEAPGRGATPLPVGVFVGEHAYRWRLNASRTAIMRGPAHQASSWRFETLSVRESTSAVLDAPDRPSGKIALFRTFVLSTYRNLAETSHEKGC